MNIDFHIYTPEEMFSTWLTGGIIAGILLITAVVLGIRLKKNLKEAIAYPALFSVIAFFFVVPITIIIAEANANNATHVEATKSVQKMVQETYSLQLTEQQAKELVPYKAKQLLVVSTEEETHVFGTTKILIQGEATEITLVSVNGELKLFSGSNVLPDVKKL